MLVGLILCFNDILMQFCIHFVRRKENTAHRRQIENLGILTVGSKGQRCNFIPFEPQITEFTREGPPSQFSTLVYRGSSHQRKSGACPKFGLAESLAYPSRDKWDNFLVQTISTCLPLRRGWGGGGRHPVVWPPPRFPGVGGYTFAGALYLNSDIKRVTIKPYYSQSLPPDMRQLAQFF